MNEPLLTKEHQIGLYQRFIASGAADELNLPANISKPLHAAFCSGFKESLCDLWIPVYKEVVKMVLTNCFLALAMRGRSTAIHSSSASKPRMWISRRRSPSILKTSTEH